MSSLGGFDFVLQIRRDKLLDLMQESPLTIQGQPLITPFRLSIKGPPSGLPPRRTNTLDLLVVGLDLALEVGSNRCSLLLRLGGGVVRLSDEPAAPFIRGTVAIQMQFVNGAFLVLRPLRATLDVPATAVMGGIADFTARANREVDKLLDAERNQDVDIYPDAGLVKQLLLIGSTNQVLDAQTLAVHVGAGDGSLASALNGKTSFSYAVSAARIVNQLPTAEAMSRPPLTMTQVNYGFGDGKIDVSGTFDGRDTCWSVKGGTFSQTLIASMVGQDIVFNPPKDQPKPKLSYEVTMPFFCFLARTAIDIVDFALTNVMFVLFGPTLAKALGIHGFVPSDTAPQTPPGLMLGGVTWHDFQVSSEGISLSGDRPGGGIVSAVEHPAIHIRTAGDPSHLQVVEQGTVTVQGPTCTPQAFRFVRSTQDDEKKLVVETDWLFEPIEYTWTVNGSELDDEDQVQPVGLNASQRTLDFVGTVTQIMPPPNGTPIFGHATKLGYTARGHALRLDARQEDKNYDIRVEVRAKDALGRTFTDAVNLTLVGELLDLGDAFEKYLDDCVKAAAAIVNQKGRKRSKAKPGEPQERWRDLVDAVAQRALEGDTEAASLLPSLSKAVGSAVVGKALGRAGSIR